MCKDNWWQHVKIVPLCQYGFHNFNNIQSYLMSHTAFPNGRKCHKVLHLAIAHPPPHYVPKSQKMFTLSSGTHGPPSRLVHHRRVFRYGRLVPQYVRYVLNVDHVDTMSNFWLGNTSPLIFTDKWNEILISTYSLYQQSAASAYLQIWTKNFRTDHPLSLTELVAVASPCRFC